MIDYTYMPTQTTEYIKKYENFHIMIPYVRLPSVISLYWGVGEYDKRSKLTKLMQLPISGLVSVHEASLDSGLN